jgi:hypothetical protein
VKALALGLRDLGLRMSNLRSRFEPAALQER